MIFILLPLAIYVGIVAMKAGWPFWAAAGTGAALLLAMYFDPGNSAGGSNDPHDGIGRGLGMILLVMSAGGWATACALQLSRAYLALSTGTYVALAIATPIVLFAFVLIPLA